MIKMKKQNIIPIIALLALVSMMIVPVCAETLTGTLGGPGQNTYLNVATNSSYATNPYNDYTHFSIKGAQTTAGLTTIIHFDASFPPYFTCPDTSGTVLFNVTHDDIKMGEGTFGFQRFWSGWPIATEQLGYQYYEFSSWNTSGQTGGIGSKINYQGYAEGITPCGMTPHAIQYTQSVAKIQGWETQPTLIVFGASPTVGGGDSYTNYGSYTNVFDTPFENRYTVTKPLGLGIKGYVNKTIGGTTYNSQIFIENATSGVSIASDTTIIGTDFSFNVPLDNIRIKALTQNGWFNSSVLFAPTPTPTPTPTSTTTPTPTTTIPVGYVRSTFVTIDGVNYNTIHGPNIMLYDVENGSWSNSTSDADGIFYIDTLPYHTINAYATYTIFANHYADASIIGAVTGNSGMDYPIYMFPPGLPPGPGNINLYIPVVDASTSYAIGSVGVQVELPSGAITGDITGPGGDAAVFVVPNNTIIKARASKTGYGPVTELFNSGEVTPKTKTLYMSKLVVTPTRTSTIPPGGVTPVVTTDPRTSTEKAMNAFSKWMNVLGDITDIVIGVVIIWLMWITVYMITGGKIIDKIMKRGRK